MKEEWKLYPKRENIEVSNTGLVRNALTKRPYKSGLDRYGYPKLNIGSHSNRLYITVHRLVAITWIPNPENKPQVNHKNGSEPFLVFGKHNLCKHLGHRIDGSETRAVVDRYIRQFDKASDISFVRLNTPIKR